MDEKFKNNIKLHHNKVENLADLVSVSPGVLTLKDIILSWLQAHEEKQSSIKEDNQLNLFK